MNGTRGFARPLKAAQRSPPLLLTLAARRSFPSPSPSPSPSTLIMGYYFHSPYHEIAMAFALVLLALAAPSHFGARNTGTILYICWVFLANLIFLINRIVWHDHVLNIAPIWCDISQSCLLAHLLARSVADKRPRRPAPSSHPLPCWFPV